MTGSTFLLIVILGVFASPVYGIENGEREELLLDDFSDPTGKSLIGTYWQAYTDRVMGGLSDMETYVDRQESNALLKMKGKVSLANNGGFIQLRLPLGNGDTAFDAGEYTGITLVVRGKGDGYYIHIRTRRTRLPWSYFVQKIPLKADWTKVDLPFEAFEPEYTLLRRLDTKSITSVAVVAAKKEFTADIEVASISLYR